MTNFLHILGYVYADIDSHTYSFPTQTKKDNMFHLEMNVIQYHTDNRSQHFESK
jgi:hypothetical protein